MNKTFAHRRHLLVKKFVQLKTLIADYPLLCCEEQVQSLCLSVCICPKDENALAFDGSFFLQVFSALSVSKQEDSCLSKHFCLKPYFPKESVSLLTA